MGRESARGTTAPGRSRLWLGAILIATWLVWSLVIVFSLGLISAHAYDFNTYYAAAQALRFDQGANIYTTATLLQAARLHGLCALSGHFLPPYVYPPLLAIALEPLTLLPCETAAAVWLLINAALWALATLLLADILARRWPGRRLVATTAISLVSLCFLQAFYGLFLGQAHVLILVGIVLALWLAEREQFWLAAVALIKFFPLLLVVYYLARRRFRVVGGAALVGASLIAFMLAWTSPATLARSLSAAFTALTLRTG